MSFTHGLVILSALISISGTFVYIRDTLKGKTKPNRVSWLMWSISPLIGATAAMSADADIWPTIRIFLGGILPFLVFISAFFNPNSHWKLIKFDVLCGACSVLALIVWGAVQSPEAAILLAAAGDAFATIPTIRKAWKHAETETKITYLANFASILLILPAIPVWTLENSTFQIYLVLANLILVLAVYRKHLGFGK